MNFYARDSFMPVIFFINAILALNYEITICIWFLYIAVAFNVVIAPIAIATYAYVLRGLYKSTKKSDRPFLFNMNLLEKIAMSGCSSVFLLSKEWYFCGIIMLLVTIANGLMNRVSDLYFIPLPTKKIESESESE